MNDDYFLDYFFDVPDDADLEQERARSAYEVDDYLNNEAVFEAELDQEDELNG